MFQVTHSLLLFTIAIWAISCIWAVLNCRFNIYLDKQRNELNGHRMLESFIAISDDDMNFNEDLNNVGKIHKTPLTPITTSTAKPKKDNQKKEIKTNELKTEKRKQQREMARKRLKTEERSAKEVFLSRINKPNKYKDRDKEHTTTKDMPLFLSLFDALNDSDSNNTKTQTTDYEITFDKAVIDMTLQNGFKYIWFETKDQTLKFCNGVPTRLGNVLSAYWTARSLAYFLGVKFEMVWPHKYVSEQCVPRLQNERVKRVARYFFNESYATYEGLYWSHYLHKTVNSQSIITDYAHKGLDKDTYLQIIEWVYSIAKHVKFEDLSIANGFETKQLTYLSDFRLLWENRMYFETILRPSIHSAFAQYLSFIYHKTSEEMKAEMFTNTDTDIVLHYRCGDIALVSNLKRHGFLSLTYYRRALAESEWTLHSNMTVWIVTQQNNFKCVQIVEAVLPSLVRLFTPAIVTLVKHKKVFGIEGTKALNLDFFRMANAPLLLCSTSTFCDQSAIANRNKVIFPSIGCWMGWFQNPKHWHPSNHKYISVNDSTLLLNPGRFNVQYIIDFILNH